MRHPYIAHAFHAYLLGRLDGYRVLLRDGDLHRFGRVALFALDGSPELREVSIYTARPRGMLASRSLTFMAPTRHAVTINPVRRVV